MRRIPSARNVFQSNGKTLTGNTSAVSNMLGNISKPYQFSRALPFYLTVSKNVLLLPIMWLFNSYFALLDVFLSVKFGSNKHLASCAKENSWNACSLVVSVL
jgi:hypothetical protein